MAKIINGTNGNDKLNGTAGNDILDGGFGADTMLGGKGNDIYIVDDGSDVIVENAKEGTDLVKSSVSFSLGSLDNVENLTLTGTDDIDASGNEGNNVIIGNDGDNEMQGSSGADTLIGGKGDDLYLVDDIGDKVTEAKGGGFDTVMSDVDFSLLDAGEVEDLQIFSGAIKGTGNALDNAIVGNAKDNIIDGGKGADTMIGGKGDDTYLVDNLGDRVFEGSDDGGFDTIISRVAFSDAFAEVENYVFKTGKAVNFVGNDLGNQITGGSGDDTLTGGTGSDFIDGGKGADHMVGGAGVDLYFVDNAGDTVTENFEEGFDAIFSTVSIGKLASNVEQGTLLGKAALNLTGNDLDNFLSGNAGANVLDGGGGGDHMNGGDGSDTFIVDNFGDIVSDSGDGDIDLVKSSVHFALGNSLENLTLTGTDNISGVGNALNNIITGNDGNNFLDGGIGKDTLSGGKGNDVYILDDAGDKVIETLTAAKNGGHDTVEAEFDFSLAGLVNVEDLVLLSGGIKGTGNALANTIFGNGENNILDGGAGADILIGGGGNDTYRVDNLLDQVQEASVVGVDIIISTVAFTDAVDNVERYIFNTSTAVNFTGNTNTFEIRGGSADDQLTGGAAFFSQIFGNGGNDHLIGGAFTDQLDGGTGADVMEGGKSGDLYFIDNAKDRIIEFTDGGVDLVRSSVSIAGLFDNVEQLDLTGTGNINAVGNDLINIIHGNAGNNKIDGGAGDDFLSGGDKGNDMLTGGTGHDRFDFNFNAGKIGHDTVTDYLKAEDLLVFFGIGDGNNDGKFNLDDLAVHISKVVDHGAGKAVDLFFTEGSEVTINTVGTGSVHSLDDLIATGVQIEAH